MSTPTLPPLIGGPPPAGPSAATPGGPAAGAPRRRLRHPGRYAALALIAVVAACLGGGVGARYLMATELPQGDPTPVAAADHFLTAVFVDHSADEAANYVCLEGRDPTDLGQLVREASSATGSGRTTWPTPVISQTGHTATADATLTFNTDGPQPGSQKVRMQLVQTRGWFVCGISNAN